MQTAAKTFLLPPFVVCISDCLLLKLSLKHFLCRSVAAPEDVDAALYRLPGAVVYAIDVFMHSFIALRELFGLTRL